MIDAKMRQMAYKNTNTTPVTYSEWPACPFIPINSFAPIRTKPLAMAVIVRENSRARNNENTANGNEL
jgi:hypothetical protein